MREVGVEVATVIIVGVMTPLTGLWEVVDVIFVVRKFQKVWVMTLLTVMSDVIAVLFFV